MKLLESLRKLFSGVESLRESRHDDDDGSAGMDTNEEYRERARQRE